MREDRGIHKIRVFVSSPGDVPVERERVDHVVTRLNELFKDRIRIETIRWEKDFYSSHEHFADKIPQATDADLVIAIFWSRLGTPLPTRFGRMDNGERYPSGTAYEVLTAIDARRKNDHPDVYVFRKDEAPADSSEEAKAQWKDLNSFFSRWFRAPDGQFLRAFHQFESADEFERLIDRLLRKWIAERVPRDRSLIWPTEVKGSPFRGLLPFNASHSAIYFGRDRKVTRAIEQLQSVAKPQNAIRSAPRSIPFLLIVGESGAGKSSLMRAGLAPRLTAPGVVPAVGLWRTAIVRVGDDQDPFVSLAKALLVTNDETGGFGSALPELADGWTPESLCELLAKGGETGPRKRAPAAAPILSALARVQAGEMMRRGTRRRLRANLLLLVDQLENIFAADVNDEKRAAFARLLFALCATRRVWVVATIRSDIYPRLITPGDFLALKDVGGVYDLAAPGESELAEIVHKSAAAAGLVYEIDPATGERLDERILQDAQGKNTLPLLQFALEQLYENRATVEVAATGTEPAHRQVRLSFAAYDALDGLGGAINQTAEAALAGLGPSEVAALPRLLRCLAVPVDDHASATAGGELTARVASANEAVPDQATARLVKALTDARIIVATGSDDEQEADREALFGISHQRVFESWNRARLIIAEHKDFFRIREEVHAQRRRWEEKQRPAELLLAKGVPLAEAQQIVSGYGDELDDDIRSYVAASNRRAQRWNVFVRTAAVVFGVLFLGAAALGVTTWIAQKSASNNYEIAMGVVDDLSTEVTQVLGDVENIPVTVVDNVLAIVDKTIQKVQSVKVGDPEVARISADMLFLRAKTFQKREDLVRAREPAAASLDIRRKLARYDEWPSEPGIPKSIPPRRRWDLSRSLELTGDLERMAQKSGNARLQFVNTLAIRSQLSDEASDNEEWAKGVSQIHTRIGDIDIATNPAEALQHYQSALAIAARFFNRNRDNDQWQRELSWMLNKVGDVHRKRAEGAAATGDGTARKMEFVTALGAYDNSLCLRRGLSKRYPERTEWSRDISYSLDRIAATRFALDDPTGAETAYFESLQIRRKLVSSVKDNGLYLGDVGASLQLIGEYYLARTELANAVAFHDAAADVRTEALLRLPNDRRAQQNAEKAGRTAQLSRERAAAQDPAADLSSVRLRKLIEDVEATQAARIAAAGAQPQDCWDKVVATADLIATPSTTGSIPGR